MAFQFCAGASAAAGFAFRFCSGVTGVGVAVRVGLLAMGFTYTVVVLAVDFAKIGAAVNGINLFQYPWHDGIDTGASAFGCAFCVAPRVNSGLGPLTIGLNELRASGIAIADIGLIGIGKGARNQEHFGLAVQGQFGGTFDTRLAATLAAVGSPSDGKHSGSGLDLVEAALPKWAGCKGSFLGENQNAGIELPVTLAGERLVFRVNQCI